MAGGAHPGGYLEMRISFTQQLFSFLGALLILFAYIGHQAKWLDSERPLYNALNAVGAAILGYSALHPFSVGFFILENTWALVSLFALYKSFRAGHHKDGLSS